MRPVRVSRWLLPGTALSLALAGLGGLIGLEVQGQFDEGSGPLAGSASHPLDPGADGVTLEEAPALAKHTAKDPRAGKSNRSTWRPDARTRARRERPCPARSHDVGAPQASPLVLKLWRAPYVEQARILDEFIAKRPRQASRTLRDLLAQDLPGNRYEADTLRLAILARVGRLDDQVAERTLLDHIAPEKPRPQRLLALGLIAARPHFRPLDLDAIARNDHDAVVQAKARRLVGYQ